ncbi:hypothetical protein QJ854_gp291 [Moumouvirus goulette]|uniref:Uncharacterized protein n=1 Tax=Moumouvirus goulette TaxID=1247379 RepID=M1PNC4_9VIRU|nr:hypothetical protein QJ854_gp291 [Moumouvirus goulette]AGF85491.1 hypothetical protein glt_00686 [Moumouvirus goulette]
MNFQYINNNTMNHGQLYNMDYLSLVNMLTSQLTPIDRKAVLERLIEMNDQLLYKNDINLDTSRNNQLSSRKKDIKENLHPSMDFYNHNKQNPIPLNIPSSSTSQTSIESRNMFCNPNIYNNQRVHKKTYDEIDLDSIINNMSDFDDKENEEESLDNKLQKIKKLHSKIIANNKHKRKK